MSALSWELLELLLPCRLALGDRLGLCMHRLGGAGHLPEKGDKSRQRRFGVTHQADVDGVALANLLRVLIDLDQFGRGEIEGVFRVP